MVSACREGASSVWGLFMSLLLGWVIDLGLVMPPLEEDDRSRYRIHLKVAWSELQVSLYLDQISCLALFLLAEDHHLNEAQGS